MKEDILEQVVDDYLNLQGYFTTHNVPFKPDPTRDDYETAADSVPSDIDVVGFHPRKRGRKRVIVVSCKSWQRGMNPIAVLEQLQGCRPNPRRRDRWHQFRELWKPKWNEGLRKAVLDLTGQSTFQYRIAVTRISGSASVTDAERAWREDETIAKNLEGADFGFLPLEVMWAEVLDQLTTTPAPSELGRLAQLLRAAGLTEPQRRSQ